MYHFGIKVGDHDDDLRAALTHVQARPDLGSIVGTSDHTVTHSLYVLDPDGEDIRTADIQKDPVFILGDHRGLPDKELKRLKQWCTPITIGPNVYFASQTIAVVNNELDRREHEGKL